MQYSVVISRRLSWQMGHCFSDYFFRNYFLTCVTNICKGDVTKEQAQKDMHHIENRRTEVVGSVSQLILLDSASCISKSKVKLRKSLDQTSVRQSVYVADFLARFDEYV
jgi:hypothetical protein